MTYSPLRYPGGKSSLSNYLRSLIELNVTDCTYFELYAGGAGAALNLLFNGPVQRIVLNDADIHIFSFWDSILHNTDAFVELIQQVPVNLDTWHTQREIYDSDPQNYSSLELGFSTFFLNRCNRSGIIKKAGPIGGLEQNGNYLLDCRFNKPDLIRRIRKIAREQNRIEIYQQDTLQFINNNRERLSEEHSFMYLDPPYYQKGQSLYLNSYIHEDHIALRNALSDLQNLKWLVSYDNVPQIIQIYGGFRSTQHQLSYTLQEKRKTNEFFVFSDALVLPHEV